jgi:hypothetical protein
MKRIYKMPLLVLAAALVSNGCGGSSAAKVTPAMRSYLGTQAPGDAWTWNITNGTFTATNLTRNYTYSGTESALSTGFLKLQMQATTDPGVNVGDSAYAIELPGTAIVLQPAGASTNQPVTACALGSNPPGPTVDYNFVTIPSTTWTSAQAATGYVTFTVSGDDYTGTSHDLDINGTQIGTSTTAFNCVAGHLTCTNNGVTYNGAVTPSGVIVVDYGPGNGGIIGVRQASQNVSESALGSLTFHGFLIKQGDTQKVQAVPNGDGTLHGAAYTDVEAGTLDTTDSGVTITFGTQISPGLIQLSLSTSGGAETIMAAVNVVAGKTMIFGFGGGTSMGNNSSPPDNIMLVQE